MSDKAAFRQNENERQERCLGGRFSVFFVVLMKRLLSVVILTLILAGIVVWGSVAAVEPAKEEKTQLVLAQDGYYEISTAEEYMEFWQIVQQKNAVAKGRLMEDITLNDPAGYWKWRDEVPVNVCPEVESFFGIFDGSGHTLYGLYSDTGYGLVDRNSGQIINLSIKDSMLLNKDSEEMGGICKQNHGLIRNCDFGGEIYSENYSLIRLGGICGRNTATVEMCGFSGKLDLKGLSNDAAAGICGKNKGEIINCYNIADLNDMPELLNRFQTITDKGETRCLGIKGSGWKHIGNGQVIAVGKEQKGHIRDLFHKDSFSDVLDQILRQEQEKEQIISEISEKEEISALIWEAQWAGESDWESRKLETEVSGELISLRLSDQMESVVINIRPAAVMEGSEWTELEALWQRCESILHESGTEDYERFTWHIVDTVETPEKFILYQTKEGKQGFFWETEDTLYQIETDGRQESDRQKEKLSQEHRILPDIQELKTQIKRLSFAEESGERGWERPERGIYETMLWKLWEDRTPVKGIGWDDITIRDAVYRVEERGIPAWEEVRDREELSVNLGESDRIGTLSDLKKLPCLKSLSFTGNGDGAEIIFDVEKDMVPKLEELSIRNVDLKNLLFLEKFPQLENLHVTHCRLKELSGIECQKELRDVSFYQNEISDISPLESCKKLEGLSLAFNEISDISVLASLPELSEVGIQGNRISDITPLQYLTKLTGVNINENQVSDLSSLKNRTELTVLGAAYNRISDISPLEGLSKMDSLALDYNEIQDIRAIKSMQKLQYLGLSYNQIQDFTPVMKLNQLLGFRMGENPGQNIGNLIFLPRLEIESSFGEDEKLQQEAQEILDQFYPDEGLIAQDMVKGDLNGDGINDLAVMGGADPEDAGYDDEREIYLFIRQMDGSVHPLTSIATLGPYSGGVYGDPYEGMSISDGRLVVKVYGGSSWRWGFTNIYEYENGEMKEKWELSLAERTLEPGYDFTILNKEDGSYRSYVVAREGGSRMFLIAEDRGELSPAEKEFEQKYAEYQEKAGVTLTEFYMGIGRPGICENNYDYQIHDTYYDTKHQPQEILLMAAEKYLTEYQEIPLPYYTSEEILESYRILTGVELPEFFLIGQDINGGGTKILAYSSCHQQEDGSYEHRISQWGISEESSSFERSIYYDERDEMLTVG